MNHHPFPEIKKAAYVIEEQKLRQNLQFISDLKKEANVTWIHALKAFAYYPLFPLFRKYLDGATGSSLNEVKLISQFMKEKSHTYAVVYAEHEIDEILENSSHIVFNSLYQYETFRDKSRKKGVEMGLRVNPGYSDAQVPLYDPARPGSRLGISDLKDLPEDIKGLHAHVLCESDSHGLENLLKALEDKFGQYFKALKWLNLGGGHLVTSENYDRDHMIQVLRQFRSKYPHLEIIMEPGAATVWQAGFLVAHVLDIVGNQDELTAVLDVSFTAHMPDTLEMPYQPKLRWGQPNQDLKHHYNLGGTSCLAGDQIGPYSFDEPLQIGDQIVLEDMLQYTLVKTTFFNGVAHPDIGIIKENGDYEVLKSFPFSLYEKIMG